VSLLRKGTITRRGGLPTPKLLDSYDVTPPNTESKLLYLFPNLGSFASRGQAITTGASAKKLTSIKFWLKKIGSPVATLIAQVYASTGTVGTNAKPTGNALAESGSIDASSCLTGGGFIEFIFTGGQRLPLPALTDICIVVLYKSITTIDIDNHIRVGSNSGAPATHGGNACYYGDSGWAASSYDTLFYLYGV